MALVSAWILLELCWSGQTASGLPHLSSAEDRVLSVGASLSAPSRWEEPRLSHTCREKPEVFELDDFDPGLGSSLGLDIATSSSIASLWSGTRPAATRTCAETGSGDGQRMRSEYRGRDVPSALVGRVEERAADAQLPRFARCEWLCEREV